MQRFTRLILILAVTGASLTVVVLMLLMLVNRSIPIWYSANLIAGIDKLLGAWTVFPPIVSWMLVGFVVGSCVYFAVWESHKLRWPWLCRALLGFSCLFIAVPPFILPQLELELGAPLYLYRAPSTPRVGEVRVFDGIEFVWAPPGRFRMGSMPTEVDRDDDEYPHVVFLTRGFWISRCEVTQTQWAALMGESPAHVRESQGEYPVANVTRLECAEFVRRLNGNEEGPFRLPTEAEWEYACRAGSHGSYCFGDDASVLGDYAWYADNSQGAIQPIGQKQPNAWGLCDMHGNVRELCQDFYDPYPQLTVLDPGGARVGRYPVLRGGSYTSVAADCRSARRFVVASSEVGANSDVGIRLVREFTPEKTEPVQP